MFSKKTNKNTINSSALSKFTKEGQSSLSQVKLRELSNHETASSHIELKCPKSYVARLNMHHAGNSSMKTVIEISILKNFTLTVDDLEKFSP